MKSGVLKLLGHSHIDAAWLWTREETIDVCMETITNVLELMKRFSEFKFCQSSALFYSWIEERYPALFDEVKRRIREGRWEVVGGSWVEFDCNIPSGESIVRQLVYGKRYFRDRLGIDVEVGWLPDSFGLCWTLPQLMRKSGFRYFLTQKLRWNDAVCFPHNVFRWTSPDGSQILVYQTTGSLNETLDSIERFITQLELLKNRHSLCEALILFGAGDHGGGPTEGDLESALSWGDLENAPEIEFCLAHEFFKQLSSLKGCERFPIVDDELYLQFHRGTYTTQARTKLYNRRCETSLEDAEKASTIASMYGFKYPKMRLEALWKKMLFNQFHDIICGSSIEAVYDEAERCYKEILKDAEIVLKGALKTMTSQVDTQGGPYVLVFNTLSWDRDGIVKVEAADGLWEAVNDEGVGTQCQRDGGEVFFIARGVPSLGYKRFRLVEARGDTSIDIGVTETKDRIILENRYLRVSLDIGTGLVTAVYDNVNDRDLLTPGECITLQVFEDKPFEGRKAVEAGLDAAMFDAWEIFAYQQPEGVKFKELVEAESVRVIDKGPVRASVESIYRYSQDGRPDSVFKVRTFLLSESPMLFVTVEVDWHTHHRMVKLVFPLNLNCDRAIYEIPYGFIERKNPLTSVATLKDRAKWEVPGQKWVDCPDKSGKYGVSIINDCKYGFDQASRVMRITLLRSPSHPPLYQETLNPGAWLKERNPTDQGLHTAQIAVYPHGGDWRSGLTVRKSYEFNHPLRSLVEPDHPGSLKGSHSFIKTHPENILVTVIKEAEDRDGTVLRLCEAHGLGVEATLRFDRELERASEVNLLEENQREFKTVRSVLTIPLSPCEIKTLKIGFKPSL